MQAEANATNGSNGTGANKAVIMIYLAGGISHQDFVDLKPKAAAGIRGQFKPIDTNVPGIQICEHLPNMAKMMDKFAIPFFY